MKKLFLLASAVAFSLSMMAQTEKAKPATTNDASKLQQKVVTKNPADITQPQPATTQPAAAQASPDEVMKVNTIKHDFGKIPQGKPVVYSFELKNTSDKPLVVENTYASCGCTTPEKIVEPIAPGATTKLKVQYNAAGVGAFTKDIHIKLAGIAQEKIVQITGEVLAPEAPSTPPSKPNN